MYYLKKLCMFPVRLFDFLKTMQIKCMEIGLDQTEFCAHQVRVRQTVQTFSQRVKPQTDNFLVLDGHLHIEYKYCL